MHDLCAQYVSEFWVRILVGVKILSWIFISHLLCRRSVLIKYETKTNEVGILPKFIVPTVLP
jgi:hypothetical protein